MRYLITIVLLPLLLSCNQNSNKTIADLEHQVDSMKKELNLIQVFNKQLKHKVDSLMTQRFENEDFDQFFWSFMLDSTYQRSRIKFPLEYITWKDDPGGEIANLKLTSNEWNHEPFYIETASERTQVYDNFELKLKTSNQRVLHWYGVETGGDARYFFQGFDGSWFLVKIEVLGD